MDNDNSKGQESVYSTKVKAGKRRTYFFDVRKTKGEDFYITLTESTKRFNGEGYSRHKIFLYKEDFNRFLEGLQDTVSHVKSELMPDYDYEQFDRKHEEWEAQQLEESKNEGAVASETVIESETSETSQSTEEVTISEPTTESTEDDMNW
ncbi:MAG: hypothetical protein ACI9FN_002964 [Saprospiraceae bacterium]